MATTITSKGQVTIPKKIRDALNLKPGRSVTFDVNPAGEVVIHRANMKVPARPDRFARARGKAQIKWRTDELMELLRGDD